MWRRLEVEDYDAVMALRQAVLSSLPDPDFYVREDDEHMFVRGHLDVFGESVGYFDGDDLVAYLALTTDLVSSGEDVEFAACAPTLNDVVFAAAMVLPEYRGRSLHRAGIRRHIAIAQALGAHRGMAQISARNHRSLRSYFSEGFRCTRAVDYPDGRRRLLLERDLVGGAPDRADRRCRTRRLERLRRHPSRADRYPSRTSPPSRRLHSADGGRHRSFDDTTTRIGGIAWHRD